MRRTGTEKIAWLARNLFIRNECLKDGKKLVPPITGTYWTDDNAAVFVRYRSIVRRCIAIIAVILLYFLLTDNSNLYETTLSMVVSATIALLINSAVNLKCEIDKVYTDKAMAFYKEEAKRQEAERRNKD